MNRYTCRLLVLTCLTAVLGIATSRANAQNPVTFAFTGIVTSVDDTFNFFQNTYTLGATLSGTYTFSDSGYRNGFFSADPNVRLYDNFNQRNLVINAGPRSLQSGTNDLTVIVGNNATDQVLNPGDTYRVQNRLNFPPFFTNPEGDPDFDPDGFFLTDTFAVLDLYDPTGTALSSFDLPLTPPNLSAFSQRTGSVFIFDGNGELPNAAQMNFRVDTLQAVQAAPEPGSLSLLLVGGTLVLARRRKAHHAKRFSAR